MHTEFYWRNLLEDALGRKRGDKDNMTIDIKEVCFYDERWVETFRDCVK